jgi:hypothetical protein
MISGGVFCLKKQPEKRFSRFQAAFAFKPADIFRLPRSNPQAA